MIHKSSFHCISSPYQLGEVLQFCFRDYECTHLTVDAWATIYFVFIMIRTQGRQSDLKDDNKIIFSVAYITDCKANDNNRSTF